MTAQKSMFVSLDGSSNGTLPKGARLALGGLVAFDALGGSSLSVKLGVLRDDGTALVSGAGNMSYNIRAAVFVTNPTGSAANGICIGANDASVNVVTTAAPGSNSRYDVIWVRQHVVAADGGADTDNILEFGVTQGVAAASPSVPAIPTGALSLAKVIVPSGTVATSGLTFTRTHKWIGGRKYNPDCVLTGSGATSIPHNGAAYTKVALATTVRNDTDYFTVSSSVITIVEAGIYDLSAKFGLVTGSGLSEGTICLNGLAFATTPIASWKPGIATVNSREEGTITITGYALAAGDTIQLGGYQYQTSGTAARNTQSNCRLAIRKVD